MKRDLLQQGGGTMRNDLRETMQALLVVALHIVTVVRDILREAYGAMRHDVRKTVLTMLGMAWGIATVVLLLAYGEGFGHATDFEEDVAGADHGDPAFDSAFALAHPDFGRR